MADEKKYYYMRLKDNFFDSDAMMLLEAMQDGYLYGNILLKLYLRSLKDDGRLMFNGKIPYNSQMVATITRHSVGTVEKALQIFKDMELIEVLDNGAIYMLDIQNFIGEGSSEADRKRSYRRRITIEKLGGGQMSDKNPPEIEIEKEKEIELQLEQEPPPPPSNDVALEFYRSNIGEPNKYVENKIAKYRESGCADDLIILAFEKMAQVGTNNTGYADMVINDAIARGTLDAASFKASKQGRRYTGRNTTVDRATPSGNNVLANAANRPRKLKREG